MTGGAARQDGLVSNEAGDMQDSQSWVGQRRLEGMTRARTKDLDPINLSRTFGRVVATSVTMSLLSGHLA
jgi:hypothetical protein